MVAPNGIGARKGLTKKGQVPLGMGNPIEA